MPGDYAQPRQSALRFCIRYHTKSAFFVKAREPR